MQKKKKLVQTIKAIILPLRAGNKCRRSKKLETPLHFHYVTLESASLNCFPPLFRSSQSYSGTWGPLEIVSSAKSEAAYHQCF